MKPRHFTKLALGLVVALVCTAVSITSYRFAFADEPARTTAASYEELKQAFADASSDTTITITGDIVVPFESELVVPAGKHIVLTDDGTAHTFTYQDDLVLVNPMIRVEAQGKLTLDATANDKLVFSGKNADGSQRVLLPTIRSGKTTRDARSPSFTYGLLLDSEGSLVINHATISGVLIDANKANELAQKNGQKAQFKNWHDYIAAIAVAPIKVVGSHGSLVMQDGLISDNEMLDSISGSYYIGGSAGAVFAADHASVTMNGGRITQNHAGAIPYNYPWTKNFVSRFFSSAGAFNLDTGATLELNGGSIDDNFGSGAGAILAGPNDNNVIPNVKYAKYNGDPDTLWKNYAGYGPYPGLQKITLNGGLIDNNASMFSGGVTALYNSECILPANSSVTISNNNGLSAGGLIVNAAYVEEMNINSKAKRYYQSAPLDIWLQKYPARLVMEGGTITGNKSATVGGGITVATSEATITGGTISDNLAQEQGGGIYVTCEPYVLTVKNAVITQNTAKYAGGQPYTTAWVPSQDGTLHSEKLSSEVGGGIWFCPTGNATFYAEDGPAIFENSAVNGGDDFYTERKAYNALTHKQNFTVMLPSRVLGGGSDTWYQDGTPGDGSDRYNPQATDAKAFTSLMNNVDRLGLKSIVSDAARVAAQAAGKVRITGNVSYRGAGLGSNGSVVFGTQPAKGLERANLTVTKKWDAGVADAQRVPITAELVSTIGDKEYTVESFELTKDNNWSYSLQDLPLALGGIPLEKAFKVVEKTPGFKVSYEDIAKGATTTKEIPFGGEVINETLYNYTAGILNKLGTVDEGTQTEPPAKVDNGSQTDNPSTTDNGSQTDNTPTSDNGTQTENTPTSDNGTQTNNSTSENGTQTDPPSTTDSGSQTDKPSTSDGETQTTPETSDSSTQTDTPNKVVPEVPSDKPSKKKVASTGDPTLAIGALALLGSGILVFSRKK